jgi:hypothetical protein
MTAIVTAKSSHWAISAAGITFFMWEPSSVQLRVKAGLYPTRQNAAPNLRLPLIAVTGTCRLRLQHEHVQLSIRGCPATVQGSEARAGTWALLLQLTSKSAICSARWVAMCTGPRDVAQGIAGAGRELTRINSPGHVWDRSESHWCV